MGCAPSRETVEHSLPRSPFYGQRQQIVLIPLLKSFFPSPDCLLFRQLYGARCDPAVRYHYYADEGVTVEASPMPTAPLSRSGGPPAKEGWTSQTDLLDPAEKLAAGLVAVHCLPESVLPPVPFTREAFYDAYITHGGESLVYDTDEAMLRAYRSDPRSVRPLPCAVAFLYRKSPSWMAAAATEREEGDAETTVEKGEDQRHTAASSALPGVTGVPNRIPEGCTEVLGCWVKATGFVGDVRGLGARGARQLHDLELQIFLTKSAGDHNRINVLFAATYTYAEQWQRACLHCVPLNLSKAPPSPPSTAPVLTTAGETSVTPEDPHGASFYYKPYAYFHQHLPGAPFPSDGASATPPNASMSGKVSRDALVAVPADDRCLWAPPPLTSILLRSRRANVPFLCFLREMRPCVRAPFLAYLLGHHRYLAVQPSMAPEAPCDRKAAQTLIRRSPDAAMYERERPQAASLLPPSSPNMWLQEVPRSSSLFGAKTGGEASQGTECMLNFYLDDTCVCALVEFIVACLLHNISPVEMQRRLCGEGVELCTPTTATGTEDMAKGVPSTITATSEASVLGSAVADPLPLIRLADDDVLVEPWPPRCSEAEGSNGSSSSSPSSPAASLEGHTIDDVLKQWRTQHPLHNFFCVVGADLANRRSATAALLRWHLSPLPLIRWGYEREKEKVDCINDDVRAGGGDDAGGEAVVTMDALATEPVPVLPPFASSSSSSPPSLPAYILAEYFTPVSMGGHQEMLLKVGTALNLMPLKAGMSPEGRVLRVCQLPLEELLLGELRDASKLAREAEATDPHWVRHLSLSSHCPIKDGGAVGCVLHSPSSTRTEPLLQKGLKNGNTDAAGPSVVPAEAEGIAGDETSCLWRVDLVGHRCRTISVTPQFLKPILKKHPKKKKLPAKLATAQGTAASIFHSGGARVAPSSSSSSSPVTPPVEARGVAKTAPPRTATPPGMGSSTTPTEAPSPAPLPPASEVAKEGGIVAALSAGKTRTQKKKTAIATTTAVPASVDAPAAVAAIATTARLPIPDLSATTTTTTTAVVGAETAEGPAPPKPPPPLTETVVERCCVPEPMERTTLEPDRQAGQSSEEGTSAAAPPAFPAAATVNMKGRTSLVGKVEPKRKDQVRTTTTRHGGQPSERTAPSSNAPLPINLPLPRSLTPPMSAGGGLLPSKDHLGPGIGVTGRALSPPLAPAAHADTSGGASVHPSEPLCFRAPPPYDAHVAAPPPFGLCDAYGNFLSVCGDGAPPALSTFSSSAPPLRPPPTPLPGTYLAYPSTTGHALPAYDIHREGCPSYSRYFSGGYPPPGTGYHHDDRYGMGRESDGYTEKILHDHERVDKDPLQQPSSFVPPSSFPSSSVPLPRGVFQREPSPPHIGADTLDRHVVRGEAPLRQVETMDAPGPLHTLNTSGCVSRGDRGNEHIVSPATEFDDCPTTAIASPRHVSFGSEVGSFPEATQNEVSPDLPAARAAACRSPLTVAAAYGDGGDGLSVAPHGADAAYDHALAPKPVEVTSPSTSPRLDAALDGGEGGGPMRCAYISHTEELGSPITNDSIAFIARSPPGPFTRSTGSPYWHDGAPTAQEEVAGVSCREGGGSAGGAVMNVTVRVRHRHYHHHTHSRTTSVLSDATMDPGNFYPHHYPHDVLHHSSSSAQLVSGSGGVMMGIVSPTGPVQSHSFASVGSASMVFFRQSSGLVPGSSVGHGSAAGASDHHGPHHQGHFASGSRDTAQQQQQPPCAIAVASSTRSGDTTSTARRIDKRTGTFIWDWRTAALDMGEED